MNTQKGFANILLIILGLLVVGGGSYAYLNQEDLDVSNQLQQPESAEEDVKNNSATSTDNNTKEKQENDQKYTGFEEVSDLDSVFRDYEFSFEFGSIFKLKEIRKPILNESYEGNGVNHDDVVELIINDSDTDRDFTVRASRMVPDVCDKSPGPSNTDYRSFELNGNRFKHYLPEDNGEYGEKSYYSILISRYENSNHVCYVVSTEPSEKEKIDSIDLEVLNELVKYLSFGYNEESDIFVFGSETAEESGQVLTDEQKDMRKRTENNTGAVYNVKEDGTFSLICDTSTCLSEKIETCESATFNRKDSYDFIGGSNITSDVSYEVYEESDSCYLDILVNDIFLAPSQELLEKTSDSQVLDEQGNPTTIEELYELYNLDAQELIGKSGVCDISANKEDYSGFFMAERGDMIYGDWFLVISDEGNCAGELFDSANSFDQ